MADFASAGRLVGCRVLVTRERPGELGRLLTGEGADVVHVPLISVADAPDGGVELRRELGRLDQYDWLVVTSAAGSERVGKAARSARHVRLAAVGTATAKRLAELADRPVDLVPERQLAAALGDALIEQLEGKGRILVAQADRAADTLADLLRAAGHDVVAVTAYSTASVEPDLQMIEGTDVLVLASGSAAQSWVAACGSRRPPLVVTIGPSTADAARELGLKVDGIAADHSLTGLVDEVARQVELRRESGTA